MPDSRADSRLGQIAVIFSSQRNGHDPIGYAAAAQAMDALALLARTEGIIAAIESAHALAGAFDVARELGPEGLVLVNLSGRGDKDMETAREWFGLGRTS